MKIPREIKGLVNNVQKVDYYNINLRLSKAFTIQKFKFDFFLEIDNLLNTRYLNIGRFYTIDAFYGSATGTNSDPSFGPFWDSYDYYDYMESLHLPGSDAYDNIVGNDKIGDYRKPGVKYQPIEFYNEQFETGDPGVIYYNRNTRQYLEYVNDNWQEVDSGRMNQIMEDKAYIDMPNMTSFHFLNPRRYFIGFRISFSLD